LALSEPLSRLNALISNCAPGETGAPCRVTNSYGSLRELTASASFVASLDERRSLQQLRGQHDHERPIGLEERHGRER
jgi:hypothetical protein